MKLFSWLFRENRYKKFYKNRKENGLCIYCGQQAEGYACKKCKKQRNKYFIERRKKQKIKNGEI